MGKYIRVLTILFNAELNQNEIQYFRGAVLKETGEEVNILFHNHNGDGFRYSYPLIQYKRIGGQAAIVSIEQGADIIGQFISRMSGEINIGKKMVNISIEKVIPARIRVQTWTQSFSYYLNHWLPLNSKNYNVYKDLESDEEKKLLLERILKGNLLSMLKGIDIHLEQELKVKIIQLSEPKVVKYKDTALMMFNIEFQSNLSIPNNIGIGKNTSVGYGIVKEKKVHLDIPENKQSNEIQ